MTCVVSQVVDMEENSIHLDSYNEWIIEDSQLPNMIQKSICLHAKRVVVFSNNTFLGIGNRSLTIMSSNPVSKIIIFILNSMS